MVQADSPAAGTTPGVSPAQERTTLGHAGVWRTFERTVARGRLASTYLFIGPEGIGKRAFANELAAALLCPDGLAGALAPAACGRCESCRLAAAGAHPDLLSVAKPADKSSLPLELFIGPPDRRHREGLCHDLAVKPLLGGRRIAVIDDADLLGVESANALLKTLEEPPPRSLLILLGTSLARQLPTIRSRSQVIRFGRLSDATLRALLEREALAPEGEDLAALVAAAGGSVAGALAAGDRELADFKQQVVQQLRGGSFDPIRFSAAVMEQSQRGGAEPAVRRQRLRAIIGYAVEHNRDELRRVAAEPGALRTGGGEATLERLEHALTALEAIDRNANQATVIQAWLTGAMPGAGV